MNAPTDVKLNFEAANILILEQSQHSLEIFLQILYGFGARNCHRSTTIDEAMNIVRRRTLDLIIVDPNLKEGDGLQFVRWLRHSGLDPNRSAPVLAASANATNVAVARARDAGASFFLSKPVTPAILMDRIMRVLRDNRAFIVSENYSGPDRRFKHEGPPPGVQPRRSTDVNTRLGDAKEPNMSQDEIDSLMKPQRITL
jgi:DNA-binding response OmpR family regulator